jgi:hypothetical protein
MRIAVSLLEVVLSSVCITRRPRSYRPRHAGKAGVTAPRLDDLPAGIDYWAAHDHPLRGDA